MKLSTILVIFIFSLTSQLKAQPPIEVSINTSHGEFVVELYADKAPVTVTNFLTYVDDGFYNNTLVHRIIPKFIIQAGGYQSGMKAKPTYAAIMNESFNGLKNNRGTIAMSLSKTMDSATSQFFINIKNNTQLDAKPNKPGYTVFGKVIKGMQVVEKISTQATHQVGRHRQVPVKDIIIQSVKRIYRGLPSTQSKNSSVNTLPEPIIPPPQQPLEATSELSPIVYNEGEHYVELATPYPTHNQQKIEVVEAFSYACAHCFALEPEVEAWRKTQANDVEFLHFPAVWNIPMKLYARTYYAAQYLKVASQIHLTLFTAMVVDQKKLSTEQELAEFFAELGVPKKAFLKAFHSEIVSQQLKQAEIRTKHYALASVPEIIVNGRYRVDPMRAGGRKKMFNVVNFLIDKERNRLTNSERQ